MADLEVESVSSSDRGTTSATLRVVKAFEMVVEASADSNFDVAPSANLRFVWTPGLFGGVIGAQGLTTFDSEKFTGQLLKFSAERVSLEKSVCIHLLIFEEFTI